MPDTPGLSEAKRALLEKYLRGDLPRAAMATNACSQHAEAEVADPRARVVEVQVGGSKRPFFFLHGHRTGTPYSCFSLARELGSDQPFYALDPYQFDGLPVPPTLEAIAAAHLKSMRAVQSEGPYLLGGFCNGGLVAYEMARQLHAAGQPVDLLVLMDPMFLGYCTRRRLLRRVISRLGDLMGLGPSKQLDWFRRLLTMCKHLEWVFYTFGEHPLLDMGEISRWEKYNLLSNLREQAVLTKNEKDPLRLVRHLRIYAYRRLRRLRYAHHWRVQDSARLRTAELIGLARRKAVTSIKRFARLFEPGHGRVALPRLDSLVPTDEALRQEYHGIFTWVDLGYAPPSLYPGKITFFWPTEESWHTVSGGWCKVIEAKEAQEVESYAVPGEQVTWQTEHFHTWAECLRMCLSRVQKEVT